MPGVQASWPVNNTLNCVVFKAASTYGTHAFLNKQPRRFYLLLLLFWQIVFIFYTEAADNKLKLNNSMKEHERYAVTKQQQANNREFIH